MLQTELLDK